MYFGSLAEEHYFQQNRWNMDVGEVVGGNIDTGGSLFPEQTCPSIAFQLYSREE